MNLANIFKITFVNKAVKIRKKQLEKVIEGSVETLLNTNLKASDGKKHYEATTR